MGQPNFIKRHIELSLTTEQMDKFISDNMANRVATLVAPFNVKIGAVKNTNYGEVQEVNPATQTTFQQVFTGQDAILTEWQDSTKCFKDKNGGNFLVPEFKVGRIVKGFMSTEVGATEFTKKMNPSLANFTNQQSKTIVNMIYEEQKVTFNDLFRFHVIPQSGSQQYHYIQQIVTYKEQVENGRITQEVIYASMNDLLEASGSAVEQYIQPSAPGDIYAWPELYYEEVIPETEEGVKHYEPNFRLAQDKLSGYPITSIQIEVFGGAGVGGVLVSGRKTKTKQEDKVIKPSSLLFGYKFSTPIGSQISKSTSGENNYKIVYGAKLIVDTYYSEWKDKVRGQYDQESKANYEGVIETNKEVTDRTQITSGTYLDSWNSTWVPNVTTEEKGGSYDTKENRIAGDLVSFKSNSKAIEDFNTMGVIQMGQLKLPMGLRETIVWSLKDIPVIGGIANAFTLGYPVGWQNKDTLIQGKPFSFFIPATLYDFSSAKILDESEGVIPVDSLRTDTQDELNSVVGGGSTTTILRWELTDKVTKGDRGVLYTQDLGQDGENGWVYEGNETPVNPDLESNEGYAIDIVDPIIIGKADYKITFFNGNDPVYQTTHESRSKFTGNFREHHNVVKLSDWKEGNGEMIDYPKAIPDPLPPETEWPDKSVVLNETIDQDNSIFESEIVNTKNGNYGLVNNFGFTWNEIKTNYRYIKLEYKYKHYWEGKVISEETILEKIPLSEFEIGAGNLVSETPVTEISGTATGSIANEATGGGYQYCSVKSIKLNVIMTTYNQIQGWVENDTLKLTEITTIRNSDSTAHGTGSDPVGPCDRLDQDDQTWGNVFTLNKITISQN